MIDRIPNNRAQHEQERMRSGIERLVRAEIPEQFKTLAILAYTGAKPLSQLDLPYRDDFMDRIHSIQEAMKSLGVMHEETIFGNHGGERIEFSIARDADTLDRARALRAKPHTRHSEDWHREYGTLLGFPPTAVEAFVRHQPLLKHLPDTERRTELGKFYENTVALRLSEAHWREEMKTVEKWMEAIRSVSPEFLNEIVTQTNPRDEGGGH